MSQFLYYLLLFKALTKATDNLLEVLYIHMCVCILFMYILIYAYMHILYREIYI